MSKMHFSGEEAYGITGSYSSLQMGAQFFQPGIKVTELRYKWGTHKHPILFQPVPYREGGTVFPSAREIEGEIKCGPFMVALPVLAFMGSAETLSCILFNPTDEATGRYNAKDNPFIMFRRKLTRAARDETKIGGFNCAQWSNLFESKGKNDYATIPNFRTRWFMQTIAWHDGDDLLVEDGKPLGLHSRDETLALVNLSAATGITLRDAVIKRFKEDPSDDPFTMAKSDFVGIYDDSKFKPVDVDWSLYVKEQEQLQQTLEKAKGSQQNLGGFGGVAQAANRAVGDDEENSRYGVTIARDTWVSIPTETGSSPTPVGTYNFGESFGEEVLARYRPWGELFAIPDHGELAVLVAKALADKPLLVQYGFSDSEYWNEDVKGVLNNRKVISTGQSELDDSVSGGGDFGAAGAGDFGAGEQPGAGVYANPQQNVPGAAAGSSLAGGTQQRKPADNPSGLDALDALFGPSSD